MTLDNILAMFLYLKRGAQWKKCLKDAVGRIYSVEIVETVETVESGETVETLETVKIDCRDCQIVETEDLKMYN